MEQQKKYKTYKLTGKTLRLWKKASKNLSSLDTAKLKRLLTIVWFD